MRRAVWAGLVAARLVAGGAVAAQTGAPAEGGRPLSLEEALSLAERRSEQVTIAQAAVERAQGSVMQARSSYFPQLSSSLAYSRTLRSQFQGLGGEPSDTAPPPVPCDPFTPNPALPLEERVGEIEHQLQCPAGGAFGGVSFGRLGFGAANTYNLGLSLSQAVYSGGRLPAQNRSAEAGRTTAEIALSSARAQLRLDVTQAYYDAELADRLVEIARASLAQADATLQQAQLSARLGASAEFDVLRARVARDNQRPVVIQQQAARELAYLRLRQLLDLPMDEPLTLTTRLESQPVAPAAAAADTAGMERAPVRQAEQAVRVQEAQLQIARSQLLPSLSLTSQYGRVAFPGDLLPSWNEFRTNWSVGLAMSLPLFTGGRLRGQTRAARANVTEARAQLQQMRELAELDTRNALAQVEAARASLEAVSGTVEQAERAYAIAELRYREGISTQIELSDARLLLQQARVNSAQAQRDYQIARMRVALLEELPLSTAGASAGGAGAFGGSGSPAAQPQAAEAGAGAAGGAGTGGAAGLPAGTTIPGAIPGGGQQ